MKPEAVIQKHCAALLALDGWRRVRTDPVSDRARGKGFGEIGMADDLFIRYALPERQGTITIEPSPGDAEVLWVEWKAPRGKLTTAQKLWRLTERKRGALAIAATVDFPPSIEGFTKWYRESGLLRNRSLISQRRIDA